MKDSHNHRAQGLTQYTEISVHAPGQSVPSKNPRQSVIQTPPGYKQTEVGVIPEEWGTIRIGDIATEFLGGAPLKPSDFTQSGVRVLPKGGVARGGKLRIEAAEQQYCSEDYAEAHKSNQVDNSYTIVVLRDLVPSGPSIGLMVEIENSEFFVLAQGVYGFKANQDKASPEFLIQLSNGSDYRKLMNSIMVGSTQVHITNTAFKQAQFPFPPLPEQRAIAGALSDVDALISSLDRLIAKKRAIKHGAMQQLLTGKTRLPGFGGAWEVKTLEEIAEIDTDSLSGSTSPDYSFKYISLEDVDVGVLRGYSELVFRSAPSRARRKVKKNDILASTVRPNLKSHLLIRDDVSDLICSTGFSVLRCSPTMAEPAYVYFHLFANDVGRQIESLLTGSSYPAITGSDMKALQLPLPPLPEQQAIAAVLSDMDAEIAALEQRRDKTRALKHGMMQELLTGKTRLI